PQLSKLFDWVDRMSAADAVKTTVMPPEYYIKAYERYASGKASSKRAGDLALCRWKGTEHLMSSLERFPRPPRYCTADGGNKLIEVSSAPLSNSTGITRLQN
ncbi:Glutathione S-transferase U1, partial [Perkinsus olseni]